MVELVRSGRSPDDLAREFEPTAESIRAWVGRSGSKQDARQVKASAATPSDPDELIRLRRENRQLRQERDILSKAAAWFARETGTLPSGSSGS
jgi:transposase